MCLLGDKEYGTRDLLPYPIRDINHNSQEPTTMPFPRFVIG